MTNKLHVYIGTDILDTRAYAVAVASLRDKASIPVEVHPLVQWDLRAKGLYNRPFRIDENGQRWDERDGKSCSTDFSFTRFLTPHIHNSSGRQGWALFVDADVMFCDDVAKLLEQTIHPMHKNHNVFCVKHDFRPTEKRKMGGLVQEPYIRKNWSSVMLFREGYAGPTPEMVNMWEGRDLHQMLWATEDEIGGLPECWNWLEGHSPMTVKPSILHYTRGTPDLPGCAGAHMEEVWWDYWNKADNGLFQVPK